MDQFTEKAKELLNKYPKVKEKLIDWEIKNMSNIQKEILQDIANEYIVQEMTREDAETAITLGMSLHPRFLYDFFDDNGIFPTIGKSGDEFFYTIDGRMYGDNFSNRKQAEQEMYEETFKLIESWQQ